MTPIRIGDFLPLKTSQLGFTVFEGRLVTITPCLDGSQRAQASLAPVGQLEEVGISKGGASKPGGELVRLSVFPESFRHQPLSCRKLQLRQ
jgi:hypothetical protein